MAKGGIVKEHLKFSYSKVKWPGGKFTPERGESKDSSYFKSRCEEIKSNSDTKKEIFFDENLYFVIKFTEDISSPNIHQLINKFDNWKINKILDNTSVKFSVKKDLYANFLAFIERNKKYFLDIRGVTLKDSISEDLQSDLKSVEVNKLDVLFEFSSAISQKGEELQKGLQEYLRKNQAGEIKTFGKIGYNILSSINIKKDFLLPIANQVDGINAIQKEHKPILNIFSLQNIEERTTRPSKTKLAQMPSSSEEEIKIEDLPVVTVLDSGISNPNKKIKDGLILDRYDFESGKNEPCLDECGHGTFVSGRVIHAGDISKNPPLCRVIMSKVFKTRTTLVKSNISLLNMIEMSVNMFKDKSRVFNLSFSMDGPDPIFSKRIDYLAKENNVLMVNSSGNLDYNEIKYYLNNSLSYPKYLSELNVYPPSDCFNILTVGSHTSRSSNLCNSNSPSPFSKCIATKDRTKPEILCEGGNLSAEYSSGKVNNLNANGLTVWSYSHQPGEDYQEGIGTSYAAPIAAAIAARLFKKFEKGSINLVKALIINSCNLLQDQAGIAFDQSYQGFGVPDEYYAIFSSKSRVTLFSEAEFDLKEKDKYAHEYRFQVPDEVSRIVVTTVFSNPIEEHLPPGKLSVGIKYDLHRAGAKKKSKSKPTFNFHRDNDNTLHLIYDVKKGGRGTWSIKLKPRIFFPLNERHLKYAIVVTQIAQGSENIYDDIETWLKDR